MEVLRFEDNDRVEYVMLAPYFLRRPATYWFTKPGDCANCPKTFDCNACKNGSCKSWGGY